MSEQKECPLRGFRFSCTVRILKWIHVNWVWKVVSSEIRNRCTSDCLYNLFMGRFWCELFIFCNLCCLNWKGVINAIGHAICRVLKCFNFWCFFFFFLILHGLFSVKCHSSPLKSEGIKCTVRMMAVCRYLCANHHMLVLLSTQSGTSLVDTGSPLIMPRGDLWEVGVVNTWHFRQWLNSSILFQCLIMAECALSLQVLLRHSWFQFILWHSGPSDSGSCFMPSIAVVLFLLLQQLLGRAKSERPEPCLLQWVTQSAFGFWALSILSCWLETTGHTKRTGGHGGCVGSQPSVITAWVPWCPHCNWEAWALITTGPWM